MKTPVAHAASTGFGLLMAVLPAIGAPGPAVVAALIAVITVLAGALFRPAATLAVLLAVAVVALASPAPILAALSGLCAVAYLVFRHTGVTVPTMTAAVGFTVAGLIAASFPLRVPWLPLLAPLAVVGSYALAADPFLGATVAVRRLQRR